MTSLRFTRRLIVRMAICSSITAGLVACGGGGGDAAPPLDTHAPAAWADIATTAVAQHAALQAPAPGLSPMEESRIYAMAFAASHDALNAISHRYAPYLTAADMPTAQPDAAVAAAVHDVLKASIASQASYLDAQYAQALAAVTDGDAKAAGVALGQQMARAILANRAADGATTAQGPYAAPLTAGVYQPTPPINAAAFVHWDQVKPFAISSAAQFRPAPPYAVTDAAYTADFNEVKALGGSTSTVRTAEQSQIATFWLENTPASMAKVALKIAAAQGRNGWDTARALALVEIGQADAYVAVFDSKYHYAFWRPITAIRAADTDGNPDTTGDATWTPFDPVTPPIPDYASGHAASAGAGEEVLKAVFGGDAVSFTYASTSLAGVTRSYTSFSQMAQEICDSRVYVGYHFRLATTAGRTLGRAVGQYSVAHVLRSVPAAGVRLERPL